VARRRSAASRAQVLPVARRRSAASLPTVPIREFFHLIHIVDDEDEVDAFYDGLFGPQRFSPKHFADNEKRWASLSMVSDLMLEVIEPSSESADQHMPLSKFRNRFGQHFHSFAWYVDVPDVKVLFEQLRTAGVRIAKPGGGFFAPGDVDPGNTIFTHPKDTFGQIEFEGLREFWQELDPRFQAGWNVESWRQGPLGIERLSHMTTVVKDLDRARRFYEDELGAVTFHSEFTDSSRSVFTLVGSDTVVELAQPTGGDSPLAADLERNGELPHSATFRVGDLSAVSVHAGKLGIGTREGDQTITLDSDDCFGAIWSFSDRDLPSDPRGPIE
jgi:catechol 2,3-dioxygenase-like lactoylglutathione lyase family enzyme